MPWGRTPQIMGHGACFGWQWNRRSWIGRHGLGQGESTCVPRPTRLAFPMAWRIHPSITRAEFDFTTRGKITGRLWLAGLEEPATVELDGLPAADLAGHRLVVVNPGAPSTVPDSFPQRHKGVAGLMTASRKVRVPDDPDFI